MGPGPRVCNRVASATGKSKYHSSADSIEDLNPTFSSELKIVTIFITCYNLLCRFFSIQQLLSMTSCSFDLLSKDDNISNLRKKMKTVNYVAVEKYMHKR